MAPTIVLITGANRGIGKGLLQRYLAQPDHTVIAANRDPQHPTSQDLIQLPTGQGSRLITVKIDATQEQDALDAVRALKELHGVQHLDVVIANAGISNIYPSVAELKISDIQKNMETNVYGVIRLYQATRSLLQKSSNQPIFATVGSSAGCLK